MRSPAVFAAAGKEEEEEDVKISTGYLCDDASVVFPVLTVSSACTLLFLILPPRILVINHSPPR